MYNENKMIDTPIELLIFVLILIAFFLVLFRIGNWLENWTPGDKKKKKATSDKVVKREIIRTEIDKKEKVKKEIKKEIKDTQIILDADKLDKSSSIQLSKQEESFKQKENCINGDNLIEDGVFISNQKETNSSNYLYDRFVSNPTDEDNVPIKKNANAFISDEEFNNIREHNVKIRVNEVEEIEPKFTNKSVLYDKIAQMASENIETKEKLLNEFENLPREMKLLLIENIMQKM